MISVPFSPYRFPGLQIFTFETYSNALYISLTKYIYKKKIY